MKLIALDIETLTVNADEWIESETIKQKAKLKSKLNANIEKIESKYKKLETIEKHSDDATDKYNTEVSGISGILEKKLIGNRQFTQVICIGVAYQDNDYIAHQFFYDKEEKEVLHYFITWVNDLKGDYRFVTFNGDGFDLPQLIAAFSRCKMQLDSPLNSRQFIDLMKYPYERFGGYSKLDDLAEVYGIEKPIGEQYKVTDFEDVDLDGSYVEEMFKLDQLDYQERVPAYCNQDTFKTLRIAQEVSRFIEVK